MTNYLLRAAFIAAVALLSTSPAHAAPVFGATGPGSTSIAYPTADSVLFTYSYRGSDVRYGRTWTLTAVATQTGQQTFNYTSKGFYAFFRTHAAPHRRTALAIPGL